MRSQNFKCISFVALVLGILFTTSSSYADISPWALPESQSEGAPSPDLPLEKVRFCDNPSGSNHPTLNVFVPPYDDVDEEGNPYWSSKKPSIIFFPGVGGSYRQFMRNIAQQGIVVFFVEYSIPVGSEKVADALFPDMATMDAYSTHQITMEGRCAIRWVKQLADRNSPAYPLDRQQISVAAHSFGTQIVQALVVANDDIAQRETGEGAVNLLRIVDDEGALVANPDPLAVSKFNYYLLPSLEAFGLPENYAHLDLGNVDENGVRTLKESTYQALLVGTNYDLTGRYGHWEQKWRAKGDDPFYYDSQIKSATLIGTGSTISVASNCAVLGSQSMTPNLRSVTVPMPMEDGAIKCGPYAETKTIDSDYFSDNGVFLVGIHRRMMAQYLSDLIHAGGDDIFATAGFDVIPPRSQMISPFNLYFPRESRAKADTWDASSYLFMKNTRTPTLFLNGEIDYLTQWFEAALLAAQLKQAGFPVELIRFGGLQHAFIPSVDNDVAPMYLTNALSEFLRMVSADEIDLDGNDIVHEACVDKNMRDYRVDAIGNNKCLDELTTINRVIIGMPRTIAQMSSKESWINDANPYLSCNANNVCTSNYPLYQGLRYQLDGLAFTYDYKDRGEQLDWKLTHIETQKVELEATNTRSVTLDLGSRNLPSGQYELSVTGAEVTDVTASIDIEDHPLNNNVGSEGFDACYKKDGWWIFKWTRIDWKDLSWNEGLVRSGGRIDLYRNGQLISKNNLSNVYFHNGHLSNPKYEICLSGTQVCSGSVPPCR